jgi:hypothetical protein
LFISVYHIMLEVVYVLYGGGLIALMSSVQDGSLQNSCNMRISLWSFTHGKDPPRSLFDMDEGRSFETLLFFDIKPLHCLQSGNSLV